MLGVVLVGRDNAAEFLVLGGRPYVRRFVVRATVIEGGSVVRAELDDAPEETRRLPIPRDEALAWVHRYFGDLARERRRELVERLTKATRPTVVRRTGPLG